MASIKILFGKLNFPFSLS